MSDTPESEESVRAPAAASGHGSLGAIPLSFEITHCVRAVGVLDIDSGTDYRVTLRVLLPDGTVHEVVLHAMRRHADRDTGEEVGYRMVRSATSADFAELRALRARIDRALGGAS